MSRIINALSVDVEDWHNAALLAIANRVAPPTRKVLENTERLAGLFAEYGIKATWFVLGEVAEHFPGLVRMLAEQGHELGVHGYHHYQLYKLDPDKCRAYLDRAKRSIEDISGQAVLGHRACDFSLNRDTWWAVQILADLGFAYDSSIFPFAGRRYGMADVPRTPFRIDVDAGRTLCEIPMSTLTFLGRRWPVGGGGYLRHFPVQLTSWAMRRLNRQAMPVVMYLHPYELEYPSKLRLDPSLTPEQRKRLRRFWRHQVRNRRHTVGKLRYLFDRFAFAPIRTVFNITGGTESLPSA